YWPQIKAARIAVTLGEDGHLSVSSLPKSFADERKGLNPEIEANLRWILSKEQMEGLAGLMAPPVPRELKKGDTFTKLSGMPRSRIGFGAYKSATKYSVEEIDDQNVKLKIS